MAGEPRMRKRPGSKEKPTNRRLSPQSVANTGVSEAQAMIVEVLSELAARASKFVNELGLKEIKPWGEFFARFKAPRAWNLNVLDERLTTNFLHYRGNYSVIAAGFLVLGIVSNVSVVLALLLSSVLLAFLYPLGESRRVVRVGNRVLESSERLAAAVIAIACILGLSGAWYVLLFYCGTGVFLCLIHAVFRPRSMRSKATRLSDDVKASGGFSIEGAQTFVERTFGITGSSNSQ